MRNRTSIVFLTSFFPLLVSIPATAKSNDPIPGPSEIIKPEQPKSGESESPAHKDQESTASPALIMKEFPAAKGQNQPASNAEEADSKSSPEWWTAVLTGILALIGFLQLIVFGLQAYRLRQTIDTMKTVGADQSRDMQASFAAAKIAADAAVESNTQNRRVFIADQRPWISVDLINVDGEFIWDENGIEIDIVYRIRNVGKTPACRADVHISLRPLTTDHFLIENIENELNEICRCEELSREQVRGGMPKIGSLIFPNENVLDNKKFRNGGAFVSAGYQQGFVWPIRVYVCVTYGFSFDDSIHQTGVVYNLQPAKAFIPEFRARQIPGDKLELSRTKLVSGIVT